MSRTPDFPLTEPFRTHLERQIGGPVRRLLPVAGGDSSRAYRVEGRGGGLFFLKTNTLADAGSMFVAEADGLDRLRSAGALPVPEVLSYGTSAGTGYILLPFLRAQPAGEQAWEALGQGLAALHRHTQARFGWETDNFIGPLPQSNRHHDRWADFYRAERLWPQASAAHAAGLLPAANLGDLEQLCTRLPEICPAEPPALIHGDLWSGNCLFGPPDGQPWLIDPAACFAHREMDLAMTHLFGGFPPRFFAAYAAAYPLAPGFLSRMPVYQLYYLLVHLNLFGKSYLPAVRSILGQFRG